MQSRRKTHNHSVASMWLGALSLATGFFFPIIAILLGVSGLITLDASAEKSPVEEQTREFALYMCVFGIMFSFLALVVLPEVPIPY